ncbi:hypothetical protein MMG03_002220 [Fibrobacter succinogenes]|nr:hypothetical protein [Fibrobacter succinogenes]
MERCIGIIENSRHGIGTVTLNFRIIQGNHLAIGGFARISNKEQFVNAIAFIQCGRSDRSQLRSAPSINTNCIIKRFIFSLEENQIFRQFFIHPHCVIPAAHIGSDLQILAVFIGTITGIHGNGSLPLFIVGYKDIEVLDIRLLGRNQSRSRLLGIFHHIDIAVICRTGNIKMARNKHRIHRFVAVPFRRKNIIQFSMAKSRRSRVDLNHMLDTKLFLRARIHALIYLNIIKTGSRIEHVFCNGKSLVQNDDIHCARPFSRFLKMNCSRTCGESTFGASKNRSDTQQTFNKLLHVTLLLQEPEG